MTNLERLKSKGVKKLFGVPIDVFCSLNYGKSYEPLQKWLESEVEE